MVLLGWKGEYCSSYKDMFGEGYAQGNRHLKIGSGILEMHEVPEPCLLSHDPVGVSGNPTRKIGPKRGDSASPGGQKGWKSASPASLGMMAPLGLRFNE